MMGGRETRGWGGGVGGSCGQGGPDVVICCKLLKEGLW